MRVLFLLLSLMFLGILYGGETLAETTQHSRTTILYEVYLDDVYIGEVSDKNMATTYIESKKVGFNFNVELSQELRFVEKEVEEPLSNDEVTITNLGALGVLGETVKFFVQGVRMEIEDQLFGYFESVEAAENMLKEYKKQFTDKVTHPILNVTIPQRINYVNENIQPEQVMSLADGLDKLANNIQAVAYSVKQGDTLTKIAKEHNMTIEEILSMNPMENPNKLSIDQQIIIKKEERLIDVIIKTRHESVEEIPFSRVTVNDDTMYVGKIAMLQAGITGKGIIERDTTYLNGEEGSSSVNFAKVSIKPISEIIAKGTKPLPNVGTGNFGWVTATPYRITSHMGMRGGRLHKGTDIAGVSDRSIFAADNGVVTFVGWGNGYGNRIVVDHKNGYQTTYSHLASINVHRGQTVSKGQTIGIMGTTGDSTGIHLHFEVIHNGHLKNPLSFY